MSVDPIVYDGTNMRHPSLCSACITNQGTGVRMLSGYCITACHCTGCGRLADLAMCSINKPLVKLDAAQELKNSKTGTQNRPYPAGSLTVRATIHANPPQTWEFNWNDRDSVRRFAADSDRAIRAGYRTTLEPVS